MTRIGLITDIHENVEQLARAGAELGRRQLDRIVCLGDAIETGRRTDETVALLRPLVTDLLWGNHDFGLCWQPSPRVRNKYPAAALEFFALARPTLAIDDCFFSHVPGHRDPFSLDDLWNTGGWRASAAEIPLCFKACPQRVLFMGHHHRWHLAAADEPVSWDGHRPITLTPPQRYFVMLAAVTDGWCATYDTATGELEPIALG